MLYFSYQNKGGTKKMINPNDIVLVTKFRTPDGVEHDTIEAALNHTIEPSYRIWAGESLTESTDIRSAKIVHLPTAEAVEAFSRDSDSALCLTDGIHGPGWYLWESAVFSYILLPDGIKDIFD
jgi:hypothetical protein